MGGETTTIGFYKMTRVCGSWTTGSDSGSQGVTGAGLRRRSRGQFYGRADRKVCVTESEGRHGVGKGDHNMSHR